MSEAHALTSPPRPAGPVEGPFAWIGREQRQTTEWLYHFSAGELADFEAAIAEHRASGRALGEITAANFVLPRLAPVLAETLHALLEGRGFVQFRGFPVERHDLEGAAIAYLGLGSHLGSFRSQNARGHLLGHVTDLGLDIAQPSVRYYQTSRGLEFHTDSCDIVGLLCLRTSKAGGASRICASSTIHNEVLARRPDLAPLLFETFPTDRRGEVPPGMRPWFDLPIFHWHAGRLSGSYSGQYIRSSQPNIPAAPRLSAAQHELLDLIDTLANDPELNLEIEFRPGDMQFIHNHTVFHARTDYEDWPEPDRKRHLLRLWLAPAGARPLPAVFAPRYGSLTPGARGGIMVDGTKLTFVLDA